MRVGDAADYNPTGQSGAEFTILTSSTPSITVTSPNGGETYAAGSSQNITWTTTGTIADIAIGYSTDSGSSYTTLIASTPNDGTHAWMVPNTPSITCLVKVSAASTPSINDTSNAVFSITGVPGVTIVSPNGGETWQAGTEHNITWTSGGAGNLKIEYSTDGGSNSSQIVASTPDDTSYAWLVPNTPSLSCLVRVSEEAGGSPDVSDATFTIIGGSVPLLNELVVDFGTIGLWRMAAAGATMMSGVNGDDFIAVNSDASADSEVAADFGTIGLWLWNSGAWSQLSGVNAESMAAVNVDGGPTGGMVADFGTVGLWLWESGGWTMLSGVNAESMIAADTDGDGSDEIVTTFGAVGFWLWNAGALDSRESIQCGFDDRREHRRRPARRDHRRPWVDGDVGLEQRRLGAAIGGQRRCDDRRRCRRRRPSRRSSATSAGTASTCGTAAPGARSIPLTLMP